MNLVTCKTISDYVKISDMIKELEFFKELHGDLPMFLWNQTEDIGQIPLVALYKSYYIDDNNKLHDCIDIGFNNSNSEE